MRAYERLLNYVKVYTTSDPVSDTHPTTARQFDLARMLVKELQDLGLADAHVDEHCYVYATLPATPGHEAAKGLGFIAHMDTSPDAPGENVKPQIHENYDGGDVVLPGTGAVLSTRQFPFLAKLKGQTLITTDGTTLLGADDKAGVAEIMTMLETAPTASFASALPPMRRLARVLTCLMWSILAQPMPTRWTATKRAKSAMKTLTLPLLLSRYTASRSIRAAQRTP